MSGIDAVGWAATALLAASYFCREPRHLRLVQALAAVVWIGYGVALRAAPVIVANVVLAGLALWSSRGSARDAAEAAGGDADEADLRSAVTRES